MTLAEMRAEVFSRLRENASSPVHFTQAMVDAAINEGLEELADAAEWCGRTVTFPAAALRTYYDPRSLIRPEQFLGLRRAYAGNGRRWLIPTGIREMDEGVAYRFETVKGSPERMLMRGLFWMGLHPRPTSDGELIRLTAVCAPEDLEDDGDEPDFPVEFHQAVIDYAVYDLLCQDGETDKALREGGPWESFIIASGELETYVNERAAIDRAGIIGGGH